MWRCVWRGAADHATALALARFFAEISGWFTLTTGTPLRPKLAILGAVFPVVLILDIVSKRWALEALAGGRQIDLLGGLLPLTLAYNKGAAFGLSVGGDSRWLFVPITFVALVLMGHLYRQAAAGDMLRLSALALVVSGAIGNLYDRVRWDNGVVDFLGPVDLGFWDFPIFNVADIAITCGAILLAISFWQEERQERAARAGAEGGQERAPGAVS
jgi:signal peptidase II